MLASLVFLLLLAGTIPLAVWLTHTATAQTENARRRCEGVRPTVHEVRIFNGKMIPAQLNAVRCDKLRIVNQDVRARLIAFGQHDKHIAYNGVSERLLDKNQAVTVTLGVTGNYLVHDHADATVRCRFTVGRPGG